MKFEVSVNFILHYPIYKGHNNKTISGVCGRMLSQVLCAERERCEF